MSPAPSSRDDDLTRLGEFDSCLVSDALDRLGLPGAVPRVRPVWNGPRTVGRAMTVGLRRAGQGERSSVHLCSDAIAASGSEHVLVIANGGRLDSGAWGGLLSVAARQRSIRAAVIDGAARDVDEAEELGFPVFAVGACAQTARGRTVQESSGEPVMVQQHLVRPGDLVIADGTGVVFVGADHVDEVLDTAAELAEKERAMASRLQAGDDVRDVLGASYEELLDRE